MNLQIPLIENQQASAAADTLYTADARARIIKATAANTDAATRTLSVWLVPSGQARGAANQIVITKSILPGKTEELYELEGHVVGPGTMIDMQASVDAKVSVRVSGIQLT